MRFFRLPMAFMNYDKDTTKFLKLREHNTERAPGRGHSLQLYQQRGQKAIRKIFSLRECDCGIILPDMLWNQIT